MKLIIPSLAVFLAVVAGYNALLGRLPEHWKSGGRAGSQYEMNVMRAEEYFYAADTPRVVIAGTSVASRLEALPADWFNLAFSGDSAFTSLEMLVRSGKTPAYVLIEINVLTRDLNLKLADDVTLPPVSAARRSLPELMEANKPAHVLLRAVDPISRDGFVIYPPGRLRAGQPPPAAIISAEMEPEIPPGMPADMYRGLVQSQVQNAAIPIDPNRIDGIVNQLRQYVLTLQHRGVRIIFIEVPEHPDVMSQLGFRSIHDRVVQVFPADNYTWVPAVSPRDYHTTDGVHLTTPSTLRYCKILADFLAAEAARSQ